jgi:hypothetical protein
MRLSAHLKSSLAKRKLGVLLPLFCMSLFFQALTYDTKPKTQIDIPKVWTDAEMKEWELPNPNPVYSARPVSEAYYEALPIRKIYKTYPVYHPDYEPEGYWEWLHEQEPEIVLDDADLHTEEDYIKAGELLFDFPIDGLGAIISKSDVRDAGFYTYTEMPLTPEGIMPYAKWIVPEKGKVLLGNLSCAMCHTKVMPDGSLIKGAQGNFPGDMAFTYSLEAAPIEDVRAITRFLFSSPWVEGDPHGKLIGKSKEEIIEAYKAVPAGAFGRQGTSIIYPPKTPDLIGVKDRKYLDIGGLAQHRNVEDMMRYIAINQTLDFLNFYGDYQPLGVSQEALENGTIVNFPGIHSRHSDKQLYALARFVYAIQPPENPNKPDALSERGMLIFAQEGCVTCHTPPLFTNNKLTPADGFEIPEAHYDKYDIFDISVGTDPDYTFKTRRGTGYYKVPSLLGLWYRDLLMHDASLAMLEELFNPARLKDTYVPGGFKGAGVKSRAVPGHEFGMDLSDADKKALIAYLLTL